MNRSFLNSSLSKDLQESGTSYVIEITHDTLVSISFLSCGAMSSLIVSYLNSVSLDKECLLLYLYKDFIKAIFWNRSIWMLEVILRLIDEMARDHLWSLVISFGIWGGTFYLALIVNIIFLLRLYMTKKGLIDLQLEWLGSDDASRMIRVRFACVIATIGILSFTAGLEIYPELYYLLSNDSAYPLDFTLSNQIVYQGVMGLLAVSAVIIHIIEKMERSSCKLQIDATINGTTRFIWMGVFFCMCLLILGHVAFGQPLSGHRAHWKLYPICFSVVVMVITAIIILVSKQLKTHSLRVLKNAIDDALLLSIYIVPASIFILMYSSLYMI